MLFSKPRNIFEDKLNELFLHEDKEEFDLFMSIVSLLFYQNIRNNDLLKLYKNIGFENFIRVLHIFNGRTVKTPRVEEVKDLLILAICYYYKEIKGLDWKDIKEKLPFDISSISYGTKIKGFNNFLIEQVRNIFVNFYNGEKDGR